MQELKRVWGTFQWVRGRWQCPVLALALTGLLSSVPGCQDHQLSGQELQSRKVETLRENQGKLTSEEEYQIRTIQARTGSEYDRTVSRILAAKQAGGAGGDNLKNNKKD
jgi:hypothetical protein